MAYTKGELVKAALNELGIADYEFDISPEELSSGAKRLDMMLSNWSDMGLRLSYNSTGGVDEDSGLPGVAVESVATNLAIRLAASYGKQVPPIVATTAKATLNTLLSHSTAPRQQQFQIMPRGAGYKEVDYTFTNPNKDQYLDDVDTSVDTSGGPDGT